VTEQKWETATFEAVSSSPKIQHTIRRSVGKTQYDYDLLVLSASNRTEYTEVREAAEATPALAHFFGESDTAVAADKVTEAFPGSQAGPETPICPSCGGTTFAKEITYKGKPKTIFECNQDKGECLNGKGFPNSVWSNKGRDS
jgi:hypothetical protein